MPKTLRQITYGAILDALKRNKNIRTKAAADLDIDRRTISRIIQEMRHYGVNVPPARKEPGYVTKASQARLAKRFLPNG